MHGVSGETRTEAYNIIHLPHALMLPTAEEIGNVINLTKMNSVEDRLISLCFGKQFDFPQLKGMSDSVYMRQIRRAEDRLNELARDWLPQSMGFSIQLQSDISNRDKLGITLADMHEGFTPLNSRGAGIRRILGLLAVIMSHYTSEDMYYILIDEPENSLHADAQHLLRRFLEQVANRPNMQVIYSTHSPSMINVMRPHNLRMLKRTTVGGKSTSIVDNSPFKNNYLPIRSSLGLTPADSLLYAPITVIVEGETEVLSIQLLLTKLCSAGVEGFHDIEVLLAQVHFLDGMGDKFGFICDLAKSQGAKPIIFLDGDKQRHLKQHRLDEKHPDVPVVTLKDGEEFEQLVPENVYFDALAKTVEGMDDSITRDRYAEWVNTHSVPPRLAYTKRINRWLEDIGYDGLNKPRVMRKAIEMVEVNEIDTKPLKELIGHIRGLLN